MKRSWNNVSESSNLLIKRLADRGTRNEDAGAEQQIEDHDLVRLDQKLADPAYLHDKLSGDPDFDPEAGFKDFKRRTGGRTYNFSTLLKIAAAIFLPFILLLGFLKLDLSDFGQPDKREIINPGAPKAYLQLSNGDKVILEMTDTTAIEEQHGVTLKAGNGSVAYEAAGIAESEAELLYNEIVVPRGAEFQVELSDGTRVYLNADSRIRYPLVFRKERRVEIEGEAYFEVTHKTDKRFVVSTSLGEVVVTGTEFNVRDYSEEYAVVTTLVEGSVNYTSSADQVSLSPNQQVVHNATTDSLRVASVNVEEFTGWKTGNYIFRNKNLSEIAQDLERWYDVEISFQNDQLKELLFTGNLKKYQDLNRFLEILELTDELKFEINGKKVTIMQK